MKRIFKICMANIIILTVMFLLLEISIRICYPRILFPGTDSSLLKDSCYYSSPGLVPNSIGTSLGIIKSVDKDGFWEYGSKLKSKSRKKILFLGDSVTMGIGIENDSTFAGLFNDTTLEVKNNALIGYSSEDYLNIIKRIIDDEKNKFDIQSIYLFWCLNDIYSNYPTNSSPAASSPYWEYLLSFLRSNSKTFHMFKSIFTDRQKSYFLYDEQFYKENNVLFNNSVKNLSKIKSISDNYKIDLFICLLPYEYQIRNFNNKSIFYPQELIADTLVNKGFRVLDLTEGFRNAKLTSEEYYLFGDGIHFSKKGHKLVAQYLKQVNDKKINKFLVK